MNNNVKQAIRAGIILLSAVMLITLSACSLWKPHPPRVYIALGDSVSAGFGVASEEVYTEILYEMLKNGNLADEYANYSGNGYTTAILLDYLGSIEDLTEFGDASVITLNIGGNNILMPFLSYLPDIDELTEGIAELAAFISQSRETMSDALELITEAQEIIDGFSIFDIPELIAFIQKSVPVFEEAVEVIRTAEELELLNLVPVLSGEFTDELNAGLSSGIDAFTAEFEEIINWLRTNAPDAIIIVNTVYNPIPQDSAGLLSGIHNQAENLTGSINDVILQGAAQGGYIVADVHRRFSNEPDVSEILNFGMDAASLTLNVDIIHPNDTGHKIIAQLNYEALEANLR